MSTRKVLTVVSMVALLFSPAAFSADTASDFTDNSFQVLGESLDSGLGDLSPSYTGAEFQRGYRVAGESLDSGLGGLSPSSTAEEIPPGHQHVRGDKGSALGGQPAGS